MKDLLEQMRSTLNLGTTASASATGGDNDASDRGISDVSTSSLVANSTCKTD